MYSSFSVYTFCISDKIESFPNLIGTFELLALFTLLLRSYSFPAVGLKIKLFNSSEYELLIIFLLTYGISSPIVGNITVSPFLSKIST